MYKLLIVDDEPLIQMGLQSMLPWQELQISICGTASNGKQALELIQTLHPDLVITDIKMPIMNGLELLEACQSLSDQETPEFIILTCYEDFPYIKTALKYQAVDYIIKLGINAQELSDSVNRALDNIKKKQARQPQKEQQSVMDLQSYKDKFLIKLLNNLFESPEQLTLQATQMGFDFHGDYYAVAVCTIAQASFPADSSQYLNLYNSVLSMTHNILSKYLTFHLVSLDLRRFFLLFEFEKDAACLNTDTLHSLLSDTIQMLENYFNISLFCTIGTCKDAIENVSESCHEARQLQPLCTPENPLLFYSTYTMSTEGPLKNTFALSYLKKDIQKAFEEYDIQAFQNITQSIISLFASNPTRYTQALDVVSNILQVCLTMLPNIEPFLAERFAGYPDSYMSLYSQKSTYKLMEWLELFSGFIIEFYHAQAKDLKNTLINNILQYIDEHICEKLVLNDVASLFSVSPNYLGHLFKKHTSMGFNEYVTQAKVSKAKYLMFHTDLKIYEIALELGFENSFYFSRVFKKIEGCSPRQYIQNQTQTREPETEV